MGRVVLGLAHGRQTHGRNLIKADNFGGFDAAVTGDDAVSVIDQNRVGKAKPPDSIGDLGNLLLGVRARVGRARLQGTHGLVVRLGGLAPANGEIIQDKTAAIIMKRSGSKMLSSSSVSATAQ